MSFMIHNAHSQNVSPFNGLKVEVAGGDYSFLVSGHFHGASTNSSTFPASSLLANIDTLNSLHPAFLMSLGDMFLDVNQDYLDHYKRCFFDKTKFPIFNAVGNHDISNGNLYQKKFGDTFFFFKIGTELFICLNTEINDGSIKNEQLDFFRKTLASTDSVNNVFIFSHRPIWAENLEEYKKLFAGNTRTAFGENNFVDVVLPLLKGISKKKKIYWMSGSMAGGPASFFYDFNKELNITFIQTAIRDLPRDAALKVNVIGSKIFFSGVSFTGEKLKPIEEYNIDYWLQSVPPEKKFNFRLLPFIIMQMIQHYYFWSGFSVSLFLTFSLFYIKRKRKRLVPKS